MEKMTLNELYDFCLHGDGSKMDHEELKRKLEERILYLPDTIAQEDLSSVFSVLTDRQVDEVAGDGGGEGLLTESPIPLGADISFLIMWMIQTCDLDNEGDHWAMIVFTKMLGLWGYHVE